MYKAVWLAVCRPWLHLRRCVWNRRSGRRMESGSLSGSTSRDKGPTGMFIPQISMASDFGKSLERALGAPLGHGTTVAFASTVAGKRQISSMSVNASASHHLTTRPRLSAVVQSTSPLPCAPRRRRSFRMIGSRAIVSRRRAECTPRRLVPIVKLGLAIRDYDYPGAVELGPRQFMKCAFRPHRLAAVRDHSAISGAPST